MIIVNKYFIKRKEHNENNENGILTWNIQLINHY